MTCVQATSTKVQKRKHPGNYSGIFFQSKLNNFCVFYKKTKPFTPYVATMEPECETRKLSGLMKYTLYSLLKQFNLNSFINVPQLEALK